MLRAGVQLRVPVLSQHLAVGKTALHRIVWRCIAAGQLAEDSGWAHTQGVATTTAAVLVRGGGRRNSSGAVATVAAAFANKHHLLHHKKCRELGGVAAVATAARSVASKAELSDTLSGPGPGPRHWRPSHAIDISINQH